MGKKSTLHPFFPGGGMVARRKRQYTTPESVILRIWYLHPKIDSKFTVQNEFRYPGSKFLAGKG